MQLPISIHKIEELSEPGSHLFLISNTEQLKDFGFDDSQLSYIIDTLENKSLASIHKLTHIAVVRLLKNDESPDTFTNKLRNDGATIAKLLDDEKQERLFLFDLANNTKATLAILDGLISASYRFNKYKTQKDKLPSTIKKIGVASPAITQSQLTSIANVWAANWIARDLVNEMPSAQSAEQLADSAIHLAAQTGFKIKVYNKHQLEGLNFGGLLAVNRGSVNPPTFMLMEWKPDNAINHQPIVIVGKGIVYDTGGINLKTMPGSLDDMKCDMGGAATTIALMAAIAKNKLPVNIIGLVPATDNRPGFNAYVPGDVITMHNGLTVEVMNTDAEGRLILADALSFAKQFNPQLVIDLATLTGSAVMAIGPYGTVAMGTAPAEVCNELTNAANETGERIAWFPFWDEYDELLKSEVADMKNIGGREAGAITAGKFLARFTNYPWIHLDIAGPAFLNKPLGYNGSGGTGVGVRMLYNYLSQLTNKE